MLRNSQNIQQQMHHEIIDGPFEINNKFIKRLPLRKNIFQINGFKQNKCLIKCDEDKQSQLNDPLLMDSTMMTYLFSERVVSLLCVISIICSVIQIHAYYQDDPYFFMISSGLTGILMVLKVLGFFLDYQMVLARQNTKNYNSKSLIRNLLIIVLHPMQWIPSNVNYLMHLLLIMRLTIPIKYIVNSSVYYNSRGHRLVKLYGIDPQQHFFMSAKAIFRQLSIAKVVGIYVFFAVLFSHCIYLVGKIDNVSTQFFDYFQIVMVTMPTVGFGQFTLQTSKQRAFTVFILIFSACLNSFITLVMLQFLQMRTRQLCSYSLFKKIKSRANMQSLSLKYIVEQIKLIKNKSKDQQLRKQLDFTFHYQFGQQKMVYDSLNSSDLDRNFTYFKETLHQFNMKNIQVNNMIGTMLRKFIEYKQEKKLKEQTSVFHCSEYLQVTVKRDIKQSIDSQSIQ